MADVLVIGIYLAGRPNTAIETASELRASRRHHVTIRWAGLTENAQDSAALPATALVVPAPMPRCSLLNRLLGGFESFDWVVVVDDDVELPPGFLDAALSLAERHDLALCQPARTADSFSDHPIVTCQPGLSARQTRFVEIGPCVLMRRDAAASLLPFEEAAGMGWGLDFVWPAIMDARGLRMGILDAVPIAHRLRRPVSGYSWATADEEMRRTLARHAHLPPEQAFSVLDAWP